MYTQAKQQKQNNNLLLLACTRGYCADVSFKGSTASIRDQQLPQLVCQLQAQHLVRSGADISAHDKKGFTTLHFAAAHGHLDVVTFLWSKGAEIDWETPGKDASPLCVHMTMHALCWHHKDAWQGTAPQPCCLHAVSMKHRGHTDIHACRWEITSASGGTQGSQQCRQISARQAGLGR